MYRLQQIISIPQHTRSINLTNLSATILLTFKVKGSHIWIVRDIYNLQLHSTNDLIITYSCNRRFIRETVVTKKI